VSEKWTYAPEGDSDGETVGIDHFVIDGKGEEVCCPRSEERARLIAAAPDLLEAIMDLLCYASPGGLHGSEPAEWSPLAKRVCGAARAAVAKAKP
jgi:hypothetical protein